MRNLLRSCILLAFAAVFLAPSAALAQEDGVTIDPGSAAGKEYAIPLESARRTGAGESGRRTGGNSGSAPSPAEAVPLFGAGIERARGSRGGARTQGKRSADRPESGSDPSAAGSDRSTGGDPGRALTASVDPSADWTTGGIAAVIVALGALGAFVARRVRWRSGPASGYAR